MDENRENTGRQGEGHLFWGILFSLFGILAFFRNIMTVAGIPLWAVSFLALGISHLLKAPKIQDLLGLEDERARRVSAAAGILTILAFASIILSVIIAWSVS